MDRTGIIRLLVGSALVLSMFMGTAYAQDDGAATEAAPTEGSAEAAGDNASATKAEKELEADLAVIWGGRRKVNVVQRRLFQKDGRFEAAPFSGVIPNDDFIVYYPVGLRLSYHFSEAFTVEASFAHAIKKQTGLTEFLEKDAGIDIKRAEIQEEINQYFNVNLLWAPIYGKISLLGLKLSHFETYVGMGFGLFQTSEFDPQTGQTDGNKPSGNTIFGFRWFITDMFNVRTEYRQYFFEKFGGGVSIPVELTLGIGVTI